MAVRSSRPVRVLGIAALGALVLSLVPAVAGVGLAAEAAKPGATDTAAVAPGSLREIAPPPRGVTRLSKPTRPQSWTHQEKAMLGLQPKDGTDSTQEEGGSCWPYFNWAIYGWVDQYLEEAAEIDYATGVDCDVSLPNIYGSGWIEDRSPPFNGEWFNGNVLAGSSFYQWYSSSASTNGGVWFSARNYNGGRYVEGLLELWMEAPSGYTWDWCNPIGLWYYACDGLGTSSLHLLLGTGTGSTGLTQACRDQSMQLGDAEMNRLTVPAPNTTVAASGGLVRSVPAILNRVMAFKHDLCYTGSAAATSFATDRGQQLWDTAVAEAKNRTADGDDRPLYWARLHMTAALRQWRPSSPVDTTDLENRLDRASRGMNSHNFSGNTTKKAFVSGFDPFALDGAIMRGNPSAAAVLRLDGTVVGTAEVQAVIFPVRYDDFNAGLVEEVVGQHLAAGPQQATVINTVSQGGPGFELEVWNGRRRSSDPFADNRNELSGGTANSPVIPPALDGSPEFIESTLPAIDTCSSCQTPYSLTPDAHVVEQAPPGSAPQWRDNGPTPGSWAVEGSGGGFLSNEIAYRATLLRAQLGSSVPTGHVHTPELGAIPDPTARYTISAQYQRILTALLGEPPDTTPSAIGISFYPDGDAGQCGGPTQQWTQSPGWTTTIRLDTDDRGGGCQLAFGIRDQSLNFPGLALTYRWQASPGGDAGQCGNPGEFQIPITAYQVFGPTIRVNTDDKSGYCNLTFTMSGRTDVALDIQFWPDGAAGQCRNYLPQGQWHSVRPGLPVTIGIDTDGRSGGCQFSLRLRRL